MTFDVALPQYELECGLELPPGLLRGWWWGPDEDAARFRERSVHPAPPARVVRRTGAELDRAREAAARVAPPDGAPRAPVVLVVHALTADAVVGGEHGWWSPVVGPGKAIDPGRYNVVCLNNLGSCYGSYGPADEGFPTAPAAADSAEATAKGSFQLPADAPAPLGTWDQARALWMGLDALGLDRVHLATGGSLGGMIIFAMGMLAPDRLRRVAPIATSTRSTPWIQGFNHIGRMAIVNDPAWPRSESGLEVARQVAHMTYRAEPGLQSKQGESRAPGSMLKVQTYLQHQGRKLVARFDPRAYLTQLAAMDHHDWLRPPPAPLAQERWSAGDSWTVERWTTPCLAIGIDSDQLYFPGHLWETVQQMAGRGVPAAYREIRSPHGHDGFLIEWTQLGAFLTEALHEGDLA